MTEIATPLEREFLSHWCRLSQVQRRALLALSHEIKIACDLVEDSVEALTHHFLGLAQTAQQTADELQKFDFVETEVLREKLAQLKSSLKPRSGEQGKWDFIEEFIQSNDANIIHQRKLNAEAVMLAKSFEEIVTHLQFQDRTSQRLSVISDALQSVAALVVKMHDETLEKIVLTQEDQAEDIWLQELVSEIHLSEIRERFITHALFDKCETLFAQEPSEKEAAKCQDIDDDIELF